MAKINAEAPGASWERTVVWSLFLGTVLLLGALVGWIARGVIR